jgi:hypothetical protein
MHFSDILTTLDCSLHEKTHSFSLLAFLAIDIFLLKSSKASIHSCFPQALVTFVNSIEPENLTCTTVSSSVLPQAMTMAERDLKSSRLG